MFIKSNDKVKVIAGKDKGKEGVVLRVLPAKDRVVVKGENVVKASKAKQANSDIDNLKRSSCSPTLCLMTVYRRTTCWLQGVDGKKIVSEIGKCISMRRYLIEAPPYHSSWSIV